MQNTNCRLSPPRILFIVVSLLFIASTLGNTEVILQDYSSPSQIYKVGNVAYFFAVVPSSKFAQAFKTDGTASGTKQLNQIVRGDLSGRGPSFQPNNAVTPTLFGTTLYFYMFDYDLSKNLLWMITGDDTKDPQLVPESSQWYTVTSSSELPTFELAGKVYVFSSSKGLVSYTPATDTVTVVNAGLTSDPTRIAKSPDGTIVYFTTFYEGHHGLFKFDGSQVTLVHQYDGFQGSITSVNVFADYIFFDAPIQNGKAMYAAPTSTHIPEALTTKSTLNCQSSGQFCISDKMQQVGNRYFFSGNNMLFSTQGTAATTFQIQLPGSFFSNYLAGAGRVLFVSFDQGGNNQDLYISDGTQQGTKVISNKVDYAAYAYLPKTNVFVARIGKELYSISHDTGNLTSISTLSAIGSIVDLVTLNDNSEQLYTFKVTSPPRGGTRSYRIYVTDGVSGAKLFATPQQNKVEPIIVNNKVLYDTVVDGKRILTAQDLADQVYPSASDDETDETSSQSRSFTVSLLLICVALVFTLIL